MPIRLLLLYIIRKINKSIERRNKENRKKVEKRIYEVREKLDI